MNDEGYAIERTNADEITRWVIPKETDRVKRKQAKDSGPYG